MVAIVLTFPPLVETNFGMIFPSTAVLAAYLHQHGLPATQVDLNAAFMDHILTDHELAASGDGLYTRSRLVTMAAARWTRRHLRAGSLTVEQLVDADAEPDEPLADLVHLLVSPYSVDPDTSVLDGSIDDPRLQSSYQRFFAERLHQLLPDDEKTLLGISVPMGPQLLPALQLAAVVRQTVAHDQCRIVLGGPTLSLLGHDHLARLLDHHRAVDCLVRADGEHVLHALATQVATGRWAPVEVPGTSSLDSGRVRHAAPVAGPNLNSLPTPAYSPDAVARAPRSPLGVIQARGCYWGQCDYCDFVEVFEGSPPYRSRRPEVVVDDICTLIRTTGTRRYRVITESIPPAFARRFAQLLCERDLKIHWSSFIMVDRRFDVDLLRQMADSGCEYLVVGLESMVTRALALVHKSADRAENIRFLHAARDAGIRLSVNLIPNLPSTTRDEALTGLADLADLADCIDHIKIFEFEPTRSSRVGRSPTSFGLVPHDHVKRRGHAQLALNTLPAEDTAMTDAQLSEVLRAYRAFARRINNRERTGSADSPTRNYVEAVPHPQGPVVINLVTRETVQFPAFSRDG